MPHFSEAKSNKYIFVVAGGNYLVDSSGTSKVIKAHENIFTNRKIDFIVMFPISKTIGHGCVKRTLTTGCYGIIQNGKYSGVFTAQEIIRELLILEKKNIFPNGVLIHHLVRNNITEVKKIISMIQEVPIIFYLHDFYTCCINYNLLKNDAISCIDRNVSCTGCIYLSARNKHIKKMESFLNSFNDRIIFVSPAEYTRKKWLNFYPQYEEKVLVIPHQKEYGHYMDNLLYIKKNEPLKIGYVGTQTIAKGWNIWKQLVSELSNLNLNYKFYYFGNGTEELPYVKNISVEIAKQGKEAMIQALRDNKIHAVFLGSICGETYSYTLYEAHAANSFILSMNGGGNIAYTVETENWGKVFQDINELMLLLKREETFRKIINEWRKRRNAGALYYEDNDEIVDFYREKGLGKIENVYLKSEPIKKAKRVVLEKLFLFLRLREE